MGRRRNGRRRSTQRPSPQPIIPIETSQTRLLESSDPTNSTTNTTDPDSALESASDMSPEAPSRSRSRASIEQPPPVHSSLPSSPSSGSWSVRSALPAGIENIGNSCYLNVVLQALATSPRWMIHLAKTRDTLALLLAQPRHSLPPPWSPPSTPPPPPALLTSRNTIQSLQVPGTRSRSSSSASITSETSSSSMSSTTSSSTTTSSLSSSSSASSSSSSGRRIIPSRADRQRLGQVVHELLESQAELVEVLWDVTSVLATTSTLRLASSRTFVAAASQSIDMMTTRDQQDAYELYQRLLEILETFSGCLWWTRGRGLGIRLPPPDPLPRSDSWALYSARPRSIHSFPSPHSLHPSTVYWLPQHLYDFLSGDNEPGLGFSRMGLPSILPPRNPLSGLLSHTIRCGGCGRLSTIQVTPFNELSVAIPPSALSSWSPPTLAQCLKDYTATEVLSGYQCTACRISALEKGEVRGALESYRRTMLARVPPVLCLKLERLYAPGPVAPDGSGVKKCDLLVKFPPLLDVRAFTTAPSRDWVHGHPQDLPSNSPSSSPRPSSSSSSSSSSAASSTTTTTATNASNVDPSSIPTSIHSAPGFVSRRARVASIHPTSTSLPPQTSSSVTSITSSSTASARAADMTRRPSPRSSSSSPSSSPEGGNNSNGSSNGFSASASWRPVPRAANNLHLAKFTPGVASALSGSATGFADSVLVLTAVIVHSGSAQSGHYIVFRRISVPPGPSFWVAVSDTVVEPVSEEVVLRASAYMLFYERPLIAPQ